MWAWQHRGRGRGHGDLNARLLLRASASDRMPADAAMQPCRREQAGHKNTSLPLAFGLIAFLARPALPQSHAQWHAYAHPADDWQCCVYALQNNYFHILRQLNSFSLPPISPSPSHPALWLRHSFRFAFNGLRLWLLNLAPPPHFAEPLEAPWNPLDSLRLTKQL